MDHIAHTADREHARMSKLAIDRAGWPHHHTVYVSSENITKQCNNVLCLYVRYTIDRVGPMWYTHAPSTICKLRSHLQVPHRIMIQQVALVCTHTRPYIPSIRVRPAGQVLPAFLRCEYQESWLAFPAFQGHAARRSRDIPSFLSPLFKYFSFFPWSESLQAARRTHTRVAGWGGLSNIKYIAVYISFPCG